MTPNERFITVTSNEAESQWTVETGDSVNHYESHIPAMEFAARHAWENGKAILIRLESGAWADITPSTLRKYGKDFV